VVAPLLTSRTTQRAAMISLTSERVPRCALLSNSPQKPERVNYAQRQCYLACNEGGAPHPLRTRQLTSLIDGRFRTFRGRRIRSETFQVHKIAPDGLDFAAVLSRISVVEEM